MKSNIDILTKEDIERIERFLYFIKTGNITICPFTEIIKDCYKCKALFPKLGTRLSRLAGIMYVCPCAQYSLKYVTRRAKYFIKKWEEKNK